MTKQPQLPKGHSSILSPEFKYVPAVKTDLAKTFARIRERVSRSRGSDTGEVHVGNEFAVAWAKADCDNAPTRGELS